VKGPLGIRAGDLLDRALTSPLSRNRAALWAGAVLFSAAFLFQTAEYLYVWDTDSPSYYAAAHGLLAGADIYDHSEFQAIADGVFGRSMVVFPYIYPPFLAQLLIPLASMSPSGYFLALQALNWGLAFLALFLTAKLLGFRPGQSILPILVLFALLPSNRALFTTMHHGQTNLLVLDAVLASLVFRRTDRPWPAGLFLSLAVLVKVYPAIFILPLFLSRKWKHVAATAVAGTALFAASVALSGPGPWLKFLAFTRETSFRWPDSPFLIGFGDAVGNVSIKGFLHHLFEAAGLPRSGAVAAWAAAAAALGVFLVLLIRKKRWAGDLGLQASVLLLVSVLLAPISWSHHYVVVLVPAAYLFSRILGERRYAAFPLLAAFAGLALYHPAWCGFPFNQARTFGALLLLLLIVLYDRRTPAKAETIPEAQS
jgi:alpha-1,2-mannosyltransferase